MKKILNYIKGLNFKPRWVHCNGESSKTTIVLFSCHPLDSITWHWAIYINAPKSIKWIFNMGFRLHTQELMR